MCVFSNIFPFLVTEIHYKLIITSDFQKEKKITPAYRDEAKYTTDSAQKDALK